MSDVSEEELRELIQQWRRHQARASEQNAPQIEGTYRECAGDLEDLLNG